MHRPDHPPSRAQQGFTIVEMSVVLVVIALIIGAVSVGRDVYRSAVAERIGSEFVQGWMIAYDRYVQQTGAVPGDNLANPSGRVTGTTGGALCGNELRSAMIARGVALPPGRAEGMETRHVYQDSRGLPREVEVCFMNLADWAEPATGTSYAQRRRNVMRLSGLTPELAGQLDLRIDGRIDARFGRMREINRHSVLTAVGSMPADNPWSLNESEGTNSNPDAQVAAMTGYIRMNQ